MIQQTERYFFFVKVGLKQDDALPVILFSLVLHFVLQKLDIRGNKLTEMVQIRACADDMIMQYKPTNCPFSKSIFHFFIFYTFRTQGLFFKKTVVYTVPSSEFKNGFLNAEDGTNRLTRNVGKKLLLLAA